MKGPDPVGASAERVRARTLAGVVAVLGTVTGLGWSVQALVFMRAFTSTGAIALVITVPTCVGSVLLVVGSLSIARGLRARPRELRAGLLAVSLGGLAASLPMLVASFLIPADPGVAAPPPAGPAPFQAFFDAIGVMCLNWVLGPVVPSLLAAYTWLRHRGHLD